MNIFAYGFRTFFFLSGVAAVLLVMGWVRTLLGGNLAPAAFDPLTWHAHEMLFGFVGAMIAGFLLTAVPNWTGEAARTGAPLAGLAGLWVAARLLLMFTDTKLAGLCDLAFLPGLIVLLGPSLARKKPRQGLIFVPILTVMWVANLLVHLQTWEMAWTARHGFSLAVGLILLLITVIGGRVIPFFAQKGVDADVRRWPVVEVLCVASLIGLPFLDILRPSAPLVVGWSVVATVAHATRLWGWSCWKVWRVPLLWVLYLGYGWMVLGLAFKGLEAVALVPPGSALHAFTAGAMGVLGLGIMTRASLGHTGRPLRPAKPTVASYVLLNAGVALRVFGPLAGLSAWWSYGLSGSLWCAAFVLFLVVYTPIFFAPRADGKPG